MFIVLNELGIKTKALGFSAGFTGTAIEQGVNAQGIETDFVRLKSGCSRINVKIKAEQETEINGQGPEISDEAIELLFEKLDKINVGDTLVLAGSIPNTLPENIYEKILERLSGKEIRFVVDATKDLLVNVLKYKPFLIKPNNHELSEIFGAEIKTNEDIVKYAKHLGKRCSNRLILFPWQERIYVHGQKTVRSPCNGGAERRYSQFCRSRRFNGSRVYRRLYREKGLSLCP